MRITVRRAAIAAGVAALTAAAAVATAGIGTTATAATAGCSVTYTVSSQWPGGFGANVSVTNLGDPLTSWTLTWSFSAGQQITQAWSSTVSQSGAQVTARNAAWNGALASNAGTSFGFNASWNNSSNPVPTAFALNGVACTGQTNPTAGSGSPTPSRSPSRSPSSSPSGGTGGVHTTGFIGCSMAENTAQGYVADGGTRMWGPYGTGGLVVQSWTDPNSSAWQLFDQQAGRYGRPTTVWVQICVFTNGATYDEVKRLIANTRQHSASGVKIYITGQPQYDAGHVCPLAGSNGPQLTDSLARQAAADTSQNVTYPGQFHLANSEVVSDGCHANTAGQAALGRQALAFWG
jgi:hypothetical protein